jgi:pimeloyl-ACP methyl ester carboxylesterase
VLSMRSEVLTIRDAEIRMLRTGNGSAATVFLHGGVPGVTPFCSGSHIWTACLPQFFYGGATVIALDLPGAGGSQLPEGEVPTLERQGARALVALRKLDLARCDVIGHAEGGLVGLWLAMECPELVRSVTVVASSAAAPSGDLLDNLTLASPPPPAWSRASQEWSLRRLSLASAHIDTPLLDACIAASECPPHREAAILASAGMYRPLMLTSVQKTKARVFAICRDSHFPTPVQLVWGDHDPLASIEQGLALCRVVAATQPATSLNILGRTGHLPFREKPEEFSQLVRGFHDSLD